MTTSSDATPPNDDQRIEMAWRDIVQSIFRQISDYAKTPAEEDLILARILVRLGESIASQSQAKVLLDRLQQCDRHPSERKEYDPPDRKDDLAS